MAKRDVVKGIKNVTKRKFYANDKPFKRSMEERTKG